MREKTSTKMREKWRNKITMPVCMLHVSYPNNTDVQHHSTAQHSTAQHSRSSSSTTAVAEKSRVIGKTTTQIEHYFPRCYN